MASISSISSLAVTHTAESEIIEKSDSSSTKSASRHISTSKAVSRRQIEELQQKIQQQLRKNERRYQKILSINPYHSMKLFVPTPIAATHFNAGTLDVLMKQMDQVLEDGHVLDKDISKLELRRGVREESDSTQHYMFLRKVWNNIYQGAFDDKSEDKIEQLNKKVAVIKNNIYGMIENQKKTYQSKWYNHEMNYGVILSKINEEVHKTQQYQSLKLDCERFRMENQELKTRNAILQERILKHSLKEQEGKDKISKENDQLRKNIKEIKQKLFSFESKQFKLQQKIRSLYDQLKQKDRQIESLKTKQLSLQNIPSVSKIELKESNTYQNIKFCKMSSFQGSPLTELIDRTPIKQERPALQTPAKENTLQIQPLTDRIQSKKQDSTHRQNLLSDTRSVADPKMNRFVRMRSPAHDRYHKRSSGEQQYISRFKAQLTAFSTRDAASPMRSPRPAAQLQK